MGSCGSSTADRAIGLDGHDNLRDYVIRKNKRDFAEIYIKEIYKTTRRNVKQLKDKKIQEIKKHKLEAKKHIKNIEAENERHQPGSIKKVEALHKKPAKQILGLNDTLKKLKYQRAILDKKYQKEEREILKEIREEYDEIFDSIDPSAKNMHHINSLRQSDRNKAIKWGQKYAEKDINRNNDLLKQQMDKKFKFSTHYKKRFQEIVQIKTLDAIVEDGKQRANICTMKDTKCPTC